MTALKKVKSHPDVVEYFKELPFYNKHIKKPKITKRLKNIDLVSEIPFYEELNVIKTNAFQRYVVSNKVELIEEKKQTVRSK